MNLNINKKEWEQWLEIKGLAPKTIEEYNHYFDKLDLENFEQKTILSFLHRYNNNVSRAFLKNLILYARFQGTNIQIDLPKVTGRKRSRIPEILSEDQTIEMSQRMKLERSRLMILLSFYCGLRVSELCGQYAIRPYSFNWNTWIKEPSQNGVLKVIGKGDKQRNVFVPQKLMARIYQWIKSEVSKNQSKDDKLFRIGERRWKVILSEEAQKILGRHINPHLLRHSCNQWLRSNGWDVTERQMYLGHEHPVTTMIYDHTNQENLKEKFKELVN